MKNRVAKSEFCRMIRKLIWLNSVNGIDPEDGAIVLEQAHLLLKKAGFRP